MEKDGDKPSNIDGATKKKRQRKKKKKEKDVEGGEDAAVEDLVADSVDVAALAAQGAEPWNYFPDEFVDVTDECELAVREMSVGDMIESPNFRLFDAMSAIEIMDPKMDSGYNNNEDMTVERAAELGIMGRSLTKEELVAIWDQLLMYFMLWLEGHTIVQTLLSCLYLHDVEAFVKPIPLFGTFVDALLVACRLARDAVLRAGVFDDEDFLPSLFGLGSLIEVFVFSGSPKEIWQQIEKERKSLKSERSASNQGISSRLEFIGEYMLALVDIGGGGSNDNRNVESAQRRLTRCLGLIEKMNLSAHAASPDLLKCFDPSINKKLLVPGPPRRVEPIHDPHVTFSMWTSHIQELLLCCNLGEKPLKLLLEGAITSKDEPNVLPRSIAQLCVSEGQCVRKLLVDSLALFLFPRDALQHCKKATETFLEHSEHLFSHLLKLTHANCARRFRRLAHIFSDFNALQHEAWHLDEELKHTFGANLLYPRPCWVWIMENCLQAMLTKLFLGFELDLYDEGEFYMIYWYADYLYGLRVYNLGELLHAKEQPLGEGRRRKPGSRQQQAAQAAAAQAAGHAAGPRPRNPPPFLLLLEATQSAVRGLFRLLAFCLREGLLGSPASVVDGLAQRFVLRFRALEHFRLPHLPSLHDFLQSSASAQAPVETRVVLEAAQASFAEAAQLLQTLSVCKESDAYEVPVDRAKTLKKVVVANQLAITQLLQGLAIGKRLPLVAATVHHPHLISVQVKTGA